MRVLVATDGSEVALEAARRAREIARPDAEIVLVAAAPMTDDTGAGGIEGPDITPEELEVQQAEIHLGAETALTMTAAELNLVGSTQYVIDGEPGEALCELADDIHADLLVVGSHKHGVLTRAFMGSVSEYVVHHAPCPVLVVRENGTT
jgi:nucleotide-binding universal stress UspA family protein